MAKVKQIYQVAEKSSFDIGHSVPYTLAVAKTKELALEYIENQIWRHTNDIADLWDLIEDNGWMVRLQRRKDGEVITLYVERIMLLE